MKAGPTILPVIAALGLSVAPAWSQNASEASGVVKDVEGTPIVGAVLTFVPKSNPALEYTGKTNKKGRYYVPGLFSSQGDLWNVSIEAEGYLPVEVRIESRTVNKVIVGAVETLPLKPEAKVPPVMIKPLGHAKIDYTLAPAEQVMSQQQPRQQPAGEAQPGEAPAAPPARDPWDEALSLASTGDLDGSVPFFERAVEREPDDVQRVESYAQVLYRLGRYDEATAQAERAIEISPDKVDAWMLLYSIHIAEQDIEQARVALDHAREVDPHNVQVLAQLAYVATESGNRAEAIAAYEAVVEVDPKNTDAWLSLGDLYNAAGQAEKAEQAFQRVTELEPADAHQIFFNLGALLVNKPDCSEAETQKAILAFRKAVDLKPDYALAHRELALALLRVGDREGAKQNLSAYVTLAPDASDAPSMQALINSLTQ